LKSTWYVGDGGVDFGGAVWRVVTLQAGCSPVGYGERWRGLGRLVVGVLYGENGSDPAAPGVNRRYNAEVGNGGRWSLFTGVCAYLFYVSSLLCCRDVNRIQGVLCNLKPKKIHPIRSHSSGILARWGSPDDLVGGGEGQVRLPPLDL
jgi:hypothetical protein